MLPLPLPVAPLLFPLPLPEFPLLEFPPPELSLDEPAVVTAVAVVVLDDVLLLLVVLLLVVTAVCVAVLEAVVVLILLSFQTVSVPEFDAFLIAAGVAGPRASPFVTLWKFSFTSPSELDMRTTPGTLAVLVPFSR